MKLTQIIDLLESISGLLEDADANLNPPDPDTDAIQNALLYIDEAQCETLLLINELQQHHTPYEED